MTRQEIACHVFAWLVSLAPLTDHTKMHLPIVRKPTVMAAIAEAVADESDPARYAAVLDVWGSFETGYRADIAGGCPGVEAGTPCAWELSATAGVWMTLTSRTPRDVEGQARVALAMFHESESACPAYAFAIYSSGQCRHLDIVDDRMRHVDALLGLGGLP